MKKSLIEIVANYLGESVETLGQRTITERRRIAEKKHETPNSLISSSPNLLSNSEIERMFDEATSIL